MPTKYEIIKTNIINKIENGEFLPGEKIYSESDLRKIYKVSSTTVIKALNDLVNEGYLIRRQGEGTYVRKNIKHRRVLFSEQMLINDLSNDKKVREETVTLIEERKDPHISKILGDTIGVTPIINIVQVALIDDKPWKIQNRFLLEDKLSSDSLLRLTQGGSVSKELQLSDNMTELPMKMNVSVVLLSEDSEELSPLRKINRTFGEKVEYALFKTTRIIFDKQGNPLEYSYNYIDPNYYSIQIDAD